MARRPAAGRPFRPFAGQRVEGQAPEIQPERAPQQAIVVTAAEAAPIADIVPPALGYDAPAAASYEAPALESYEPPASAYEAPVQESPSSPPYEAWETALDATPAVAEEPAAPIIEKAPDAPDATDEPHVSQPLADVLEFDVPEHAAAVSGLTSVFEWTGPEPVVAATAEEVMITPDADVTAEVPAFPDDPMADVAAVAESSAIQSAPIPAPRQAYETPIYVTPANQASVDTMIDEVDAAFIAAGLPTNGDDASEQAQYAATLLEAISRRLRSGELRLASGAKVNSEESALATVLASLLASR